MPPTVGIDKSLARDAIHLGVAGSEVILTVGGPCGGEMALIEAIVHNRDWLARGEARARSVV